MSKTPFEHNEDCATQCGFSGENSDVTTHPCTCKNPNPMTQPITATAEQIVEAIAVRLPLKVMDKPNILEAVRNALQSLPAVDEREVLNGFMKWWNERALKIAPITGYIEPIDTEDIDTYINSKQG